MRIFLISVAKEVLLLQGSVGVERPWMYFMEMWLALEKLEMNETYR